MHGHMNVKLTLPVDSDSHKMQDRSSATQNVTRCPHVTQLGSQNPTFADLETQEGQMSVVILH